MATANVEPRAPEGLVRAIVTNRATGEYEWHEDEPLRRIIGIEIHPSTKVDFYDDKGKEIDPWAEAESS